LQLFRNQILRKKERKEKLRGETCENKMRAAKYYGRNDIRIEDIPVPIPKEDEVLIDIEWCGICGTDLHEYEYGQLSTFRPYGCPSC
jgi:hypothetical protein